MTFVTTDPIQTSIGICTTQDIRKRNTRFIMSERMIELQRAKLGLPPMGQSGNMVPVATTPKAAAPASRTGSITIVQQTSQQVAAAALLSEDGQLKQFLQRLQTRDDSNPATTSGPTVPSALSRRLLQKQGVGYMDDTVAAITSAAADQFLATVLQQATACRDRRLKGAELMRDEARQRRKHKIAHMEDLNDRKRRKLAKDDIRTKANLAAVAAAKELSTGSKTVAASTVPATAGVDDDNKTKKSKKKKLETENGNKKKDDNDESSDDSLDDEEEYYENYYNGEGVEIHGDDDEDELDTMLLLRDLERPLEAWDFNLTGKLGLGLTQIEKEETNRLEEKEMDDGVEQQENGALPAENGQADEAPPSPSTNKSLCATPNAKGDKKSPPGSAQKSGVASRVATPAPVAMPNPKPAPT